MFRRLADRVSNAVAQATMSTEQQHIQTLCSMGYPEADARAAYNACGGDVDRAAERLLSSSSGNNNHHHSTEALQQQEDDDLQRALQASMIQPQNFPSDNNANNNTSIRSAASRKAGQAALSRFEQKQQPKKKKNISATGNHPTTPDSSNVGNTASKKRSTSPVPSHPGVKVPAKLSDKSKEEQIVRTADRLKSYPQAVDTLYKALKGTQGIELYLPHHSRAKSMTILSNSNIAKILRCLV